MIIGGAQENTLLNCLDLIREHKDDVLLLTGPALGPEGDLLSQDRAGELPVKVLPSLRRDIHPKWDWLANREINRALKDFNPDVVHTHSAKGGLLGRRAEHGEASRAKGAAGARNNRPTTRLGARPGGHTKAAGETGRDDWRDDGGRAVRHGLRRRGGGPSPRDDGWRCSRRSGCRGSRV